MGMSPLSSISKCNSRIIYLIIVVYNMVQIKLYFVIDLEFGYWNYRNFN